MPRYNLNQDDVDIIIQALNKASDKAWNPNEQKRIRRLVLRLQGKINALNQNINTIPVEISDLKTDTTSVNHDDQIWGFYTNKDK